MTWIMLLVGGCAEESAGEAVEAAPAEIVEEAAPEVPAQVQSAIAIAHADDKAKALTDAGMTIEDFDALMFEIAEDPGLSEAFARAKGASPK